MASLGNTSLPLSVNTDGPPDLVTCLQGRFKNLHPVGYGSSGLVFSGHDVASGRDVAVKRLVFANQPCCRQGLREISIMKKLKHENIVTVFELLDEKGHSVDEQSLTNSNLTTAFLVQELLDVTLAGLIQSGQLTLGHIKLITYQLLCSLKYIHSANVLHRDLKPSNVLVNCDTLLVKIGDFGLARVVDPSYSHQGYLTRQVGSSGYRSPELLMNTAHYTQAIDIWAAGCILAEMILGHPLFPGSHDIDQLFHIVDTLHLSQHEWGIVLGVMPNKVMKNHPMRPRHSLQSRFLQYHDADLLEILEVMLTFDPDHRGAADELLRLGYMKEYLTNDEAVADTPFFIEHEVDDLPMTTLQQLVVCQNSFPFLCDSGESQSRGVEDSDADRTNEMLMSGTELEQSTSNNDAPSQSSSRENLVSTNAGSTQSLSSVKSSVSACDSGSYDSLLTLEEILNIPSPNPSYVDTCETSPTPSCDRLSPDDQVALKNLRNTRSCDSLASNPRLSDSPSIFDLVLNKENSSINHVKSSEKSEDDEKDVAEVSEKKLLEDQELEQLLFVCQLSDSEALLCQESVPDNSRGIKDLNLGFRLSDDCVAKDSGIPDSNKGCTAPGAPKSKADEEKNKSVDYPNKAKSKEEYEATLLASRKLLLDKIESEKASSEEMRRQCHADLTGEELDELYRLPTDHLRQNNMHHDLSNSRLKQAMHRNVRREEKRERLYEDFYSEGACGGTESFSTDDPARARYCLQQSPQQLSEDETNVVHLEILSTGADNVIMCHNNFTPHVQQTVNTPSHNVTAHDSYLSRDVSSSPEAPASPISRQCGARPKKSPKKQRAL